MQQGLRVVEPRGGAHLVPCVYRIVPVKTPWQHIWDALKWRRSKPLEKYGLGITLFYPDPEWCEILRHLPSEEREDAIALRASGLFVTTDFQGLSYSWKPPFKAFAVAVYDEEDFGSYGSRYIDLVEHTEGLRALTTHT